MCGVGKGSGRGEGGWETSFAHHRVGLGHAGSLRADEGPLLSAVLNSCRAQHYLDAVLEMDVLGLFLVLEYYGLCPEALPLRGRGGERGRKPGTPGVSQQKAPAPDTERLTVIFLLRKKKPFIILLGLSETIWADFSRPVFTCKSGRAYLSSPTHPYEPR